MVGSKANISQNSAVMSRKDLKKYRLKGNKKDALESLKMQ